jgi:hypothetical protein
MRGVVRLKGRFCTTLPTAFWCRQRQSRLAADCSLSPPLALNGGGDRADEAFRSNPDNMDSEQAGSAN